MDLPGVETRDEESLPLPSSRWLTGAAIVAVFFYVAVTFARQQLGDPVLYDDYRVEIASGAQTATSAEIVAGIATRYLNDQTAELAGPELHRPPRILAASAVFARDAAKLEARVPPGAVAQRPDRIVWVVEVTGDLLNLRDLAWSSGGSPDASGTIVIDDATKTILGVYPDHGG
jgi:hypothetical protein